MIETIPGTKTNSSWNKTRLDATSGSESIVNMQKFFTTVCQLVFFV
jgi:hypothetical protein